MPIQLNDANQHFGHGDASFQAAGGEAGLKQLVDDFYEIMQADAKHILDMHPNDMHTTRDKLSRFLCGWTGGPKRFQEKYGPISIPGSHAHLDIKEAERDSWLACMQKALDKQPYTPEFKDYLLLQLSRPAERIRQVNQMRRQQP